jgi:transcriptional regulator with XRE-family HTH domain
MIVIVTGMVLYYYKYTLPGERNRMPLYVVGKVIKEARIRRDISQEELCFGLCAVSTLSKIENCVQNPTKKMMEALLQRLGIPFGIYNVSVTEEEFERGKIERDIINMVGNGDCRILPLLEKYRDYSGEMDPLENQFYLYMSAVEKSARWESTDITMPLYTEALQQTIPDFTTGTELHHEFFTINELMILNNIAIEEYKAGRRDIAIGRLYFIKEYFQKNEVDLEEKAKKYPVILFNLSNWEEDRQNYAAEVTLSEEGIQFCVEYGKLAYFDLLVFNKGEGLACLGKTNEGKKYFMRAFAIMAAKGKHERIRIGMEDINKKFGYTFSENEELFS